MVTVSRASAITARRAAGSAVADSAVLPRRPMWWPRFLTMAAAPVELPASAQAALAYFGGMAVSPDNVLALYTVIMEEVRRLELSLMNFQMRHQAAPKLGGDPVSGPAADRFNAVTAQLLGSCRTSIKELRTVAEGLTAAARAYGQSEEQITASFDPSRVRSMPTPVGSMR